MSVIEKHIQKVKEVIIEAKEKHEEYTICLKCLSYWDLYTKAGKCKCDWTKYHCYKIEYESDCPQHLLNFINILESL